MNRKNFIKTIGVVTTGSFLIGCEKLIRDNVILPQDLDDISIEEAQNWFESDYLSELKSARIGQKMNDYKRKANWEKA